MLLQNVHLRTIRLSGNLFGGLWVWNSLASPFAWLRLFAHHLSQVIGAVSGGLLFSSSTRAFMFIAARSNQVVAAADVIALELAETPAEFPRVLDVCEVRKLRRADKLHILRLD